MQLAHNCIITLSLLANKLATRLFTAKPTDSSPPLIVSSLPFTQPDSFLFFSSTFSSWFREKLHEKLSLSRKHNFLGLRSRWKV